MEYRGKMKALNIFLYAVSSDFHVRKKPDKYKKEENKYKCKKVTPRALVIKLNIV
jgi:hypothetical protein